MHDNHVALKENEEAYTLSHDFWQMFNGRYSCDMAIQIRKYNDLNTLKKDNIESGEVWSAIAVQPEGHYEPTFKYFTSLPLSSRHPKEAAQMDALQGDNKLWKRYYAINTEWVQRWLAYV